MKCSLHKTFHPSFRNNEFNRVTTSLNESHIISPQQYASKDLLKTQQKVLQQNSSAKYSSTQIPFVYEFVYKLS